MTTQTVNALLTGELTRDLEMLGRIFMKPNLQRQARDIGEGCYERFASHVDEMSSTQLSLLSLALISYNDAVSPLSQEIRDASRALWVRATRPPLAPGSRTTILAQSHHLLQIFMQRHDKHSADLVIDRLQFVVFDGTESDDERFQQALDVYEKLFAR